MVADTDFDGCMRACRKKGRHTRVWGECEIGVPPERTVSMSKVFRDTDGQNSIGFDVYTADQLAEDIIEPVLRGVRMWLGPERTEAVGRGEPILPFENEGDGMEVARMIACAIIRRNDAPELIPIPGVPECGPECFCRKGDRCPGA